jgi:moderate conductance mechanosensitive channel
LLPIFRMALLVLIAVMAVLTALSSLGVDVAPLIAGAGVFGVAIGFGSQTLVRDVISGIFYLVDDAFRIGEEIESGKFKGIVESFSLRSVKLRHSNGPLFTVPFGQLGAVQNLSRYWAIDKFSIQVTYDTDLERARKIIKKIGEELAADPEFSADLIEPMKLQGVEKFGDYGIDLRVKLKSFPGKQHAVRREAYLRIKQAFDAAGIKFASPTVQVAGGAENAAAAREMLAVKAAADAPPAAA